MEEIELSQSSTINTLDDFQDDILTHILSFLPIKEAFRTTILSKRWISLCYSLSTLHFDDIQSGVTNIETWIQFCEMLDAIILSPHAQQQTLKTFHLKCQYNFFKFDHSNIIKWIEAAKQRCVEDLSLFLLLGITLEPTAIFSSKTLVVLKLCRLNVSTLSNCSVRLPLLKILNVVDIHLDDMGDLNKIIHGCPILEDLKTAYIHASIGVTAREYSTSLSKLIKASIRLFEVPLRTVSYVKFLTVTGMGKSLPDEKINSYYKGYPVFENLIELRLFWFDNSIHDWDDVVKILQKCPKLQAISISKWTSTSRDDWKYPYHVPICISSHLKTCILDYNAVEGDFRFATYILQNARLLQVMTIRYRTSENESPQFLKDLSSCQRISPAFGGKVGWVVPNSKDKDETYNQWASQNRFKIDDTIRFKYEKDSVMAVSEEEYEKCKSTRPLFFGNNGDTVFKFERPGLFYFISGGSDHCTRGQKMIIKILDIEAEQEPIASSPQSANENAPTVHSKAAQITPITITISTLFALSFLGMIYA